MKKNLMVIGSLVALTFGAGTAVAGGKTGSVGIGAEFQLGDAIAAGPLDVRLGGVSANYDLGKFHVGGFFSMADHGGDDDTDVAFGGRFYYHIHSTAMSDFSIGGSVGIGLIGDRTDNVDNNATVMLIEPGLQIRAFVASNVALSFNAGLSIGTADADGLSLNGHPVGSAGVHYYFY